MLWWPLFFIIQAYANDPTVEKYCYPSESRMNSSLRQLRTILVPSDKAETDGVCISMHMSSHRQELIHNYLKRLDPEMSITFSTADIKREPCRLQVEKIKNINNQNTDISATTVINAEATTTQAQGRDTMQIQTLNDFELMVNQESIKGKCRYVSPQRYEITIEVKKDLKPLVPPTPPGTVVIIHQAELPKNQETSYLSTQLTLTRGDKIEIGNVIKDLRQKNSGISIEPSIGHNETNVQTQEKVYLSLE